ncbi:Hypothetical predicted protein [Mytilus galloprovincialis]|uniref:Reverse transcriptase domain-containing protein n=1 Tax=Mytilus galloprovincialis TaxID=29158 RepID=A0A8B6GQN3_MYTGA|nr:Hypothetical predicted protein [Mytilus galloprovincialis]
MEHIIFSSIMNYLDNNNLLSSYQYGFRKNHSCEQQLINTTEDLARIRDNKSQADILILDFSKAFDTVPHRHLVHKLRKKGIDKYTVNWIDNWLQNRKQTVLLDGFKSHPATVRSGVPQGTVLGPLLFLLYINDIGDNLTTGTSIRLFADDCLLYRDIKTHNDTEILQKDLTELEKWSIDWKMSFNPKKCYVLQTTHNIRNRIIRPYFLHSTKLELKEHNPYLGVELDSKLNWNHHITSKVNKASQQLNFKILYHQVATEIPQYYLINNRKTRHSHTVSIMQPQCNTSEYEYSFYPRTIRDWNHLPGNIATDTDSDSFKENLWSHFHPETRVTVML